MKQLVAVGLPMLFPAASLAIFFVVYFLFCVVSVGLSAPTGLFVPGMLMVSPPLGCDGAHSGQGGSLGRLVGLLLHSYVDSSIDPGQVALLGAAALLAGSGRIRITLTLVMLETTGTLNLITYVATAAICATLVGDLLTSEGLYHAQMEAAGIPFLPPRVTCSQAVITVGAVMTRNCVTLAETLTKREVLQRKAEGRLGGHNGFPVVSSIGTLKGLLLIKELNSKEHQETELIDKIMDSAPFKVPEHWPLCRAYQLFTRLGLRHLVVVSSNDRPVGIITRWNLQSWLLSKLLKDHEARHSGLDDSEVSPDYGATPLENSTFLLDQFCTMFGLRNSEDIFQYTRQSRLTSSSWGAGSNDSDVDVSPLGEDADQPELRPAHDNDRASFFTPRNTSLD